MPAQTRARTRGVIQTLGTHDESLVDVARFKNVVNGFRLADSPDEQRTIAEATIKTTPKVSPEASSSDRRVIDRRKAKDSSPPALHKRRRTKSSYAPPSKYAHLNGVTDAIAHGLLVLLVGHNPGIATAKSGHAYAHPSNLFWKLLYASGLTDRRCLPQEDQALPQLYSLGLTNLVGRPSKDMAQLSKAEQAAGTPLLEEKVRTYRPEVVCLVGKSIWEAVWKWKHGRPIAKNEFAYGWQTEEHNLGVVTADLDGGQHGCNWKGARVFVATTTSGLAATLSLAEKEAVWRPLGDWARQRRVERYNANNTVCHNTERTSPSP